MKIGILAAGITPDALRSQYPTYAQMFAQQISALAPSLSFEIFDVRLDQFPSDADDCDGWLITGSKSDAYGDEPWITRLCELIREVDGKGQVLVGICFGHQIIARALGGRVAKFDGGWGVGVHNYQVADNMATPLGLKNLAFCAFHQDQVVEKPAKMTSFLSNDFCQHAGLIYKDRILTFQGHPEFSKAYEMALIDLYDGVTLTPEEAQKARHSVQQENIDSQQLMAWIGAFLQG
ncbi:glutamine amidotransferase [Marinomonas sp. M1K-6]|uniref:Glutamine amidotransferase n=1 Tax=Marinomonas profundi TaxID=2726122 RepID=A0A847R7M2_9GAMM|nr:glutamine amidotransferase [Marinomonas profundi]NLQ17117.1 glutamine amidotransferase [Marinomonas profundi]UDV04686.1 glutamine amidotransferase [Marinomonas profundi]